MTTELRKIRNPDAEKVKILDQNLKALKQQHELDLHEKEKINSELKLDLDAANKKAERQKVEITSLSRCVTALEEKLKELHSAHAKIENKLTNNAEDTNVNKDAVSNDKIISELKHELATANKKAEKQKVEITGLSRFVTDLEEKLKELQANIENKLTNKVDKATNLKKDGVWNDDWETSPPSGLMKHSTKTSEHNSPVLRTKVMKVNGFDYNLFNADDLFNLVSLYGNVVRIKILLNEEPTAMVEMDDPAAVERCIQFLNNCPFHSNTYIKITFSNENVISDELCPMLLPDDTPCFKNYASSKNNRFSSAEELTPNKILRFLNAPPGEPNCTVTNLLKILNSRDFKPTVIRKFPNQGLESSSGLIQFRNTADAILAIMRCNNLAIKSRGKIFILHLNFLPGAETND